MSAGATTGTFTVDALGQPRYEIPLIAPPGVRGMEPHLSIKYTGGHVNGPLGVGFSLGGLSAITRCNKTLDQDGVISVPAYTTSTTGPQADALCLDGLRLVPVPAGPGNPPGTQEFRTFPDTHAKILAMIDPIFGWKSFDVQEKSGLVRHYGADQFGTNDPGFPNTLAKHGSQVLAPQFGCPPVDCIPDPGIVAAWWLSGESDRRENYVHYSYLNNHTNNTTSDIVIEQIDYGGNSVLIKTSGLDAQHYHTSFTGGMVVEREYRIDSIQMTSWNVPVRTYNLSYHSSIGTRRFLLDAITECTGDGDPNDGSVCKPPTKFQWSENEAHFSPPVKTPVITNYLNASGNSQAWTMADVNGDGLNDIVALVPDFAPEYGGFGNPGIAGINAFVSLATGTGFAPPSLWFHDQNFLPPTTASVPGPFQLTVVDMDQDGRADVVVELAADRTTSSYRYLHALPGGGFELKASGVPRVANTPYWAWAIGDVTGDGVADLITCGGFGDDRTIYQWSLHPWSPALADFDFAGVPIDPLNQQNVQCGAAQYFQFIDLLGAGQVDVLYPTLDGSANLSQYVNRLHLGGTTSPWTTNLTVYPPGLTWYDANGDGLVDAFLPGPSTYNNFAPSSLGTVWMNHGIGASQYYALPKEAPYDISGSPQALDFDGDGQTDLLLARNACPQGTYSEPPNYACWHVDISDPTGTAVLAPKLVALPIPFDPNLAWFTPQVTDINGDGRPDLVVPHHGTDPLVWQTNDPTFNDGTFDVFINSGPEDLLVAVTDGMNPIQDTTDPAFVPSVSIEYGNLVDRRVLGNGPLESRAYIAHDDPQNDCSYPRTCVKGAGTVVSRYTLNNGENGRRSFALRYRDGRYERFGRGFLGFGERIVIDEQSGGGTAEFYGNAYHDTTFNAYPYAGVLTGSWSWAVANASLPGPTQIELTYRTETPDVVPSAGPPNAPLTFFVLDQSSEVVREEGMVHPTASFTVYDYVKSTASSPALVLGDSHRLALAWDTYGNILSEERWTDNVDQKDHVQRTMQYDFANWLVGDVGWERVCSSTSTETKCRSTTTNYNTYGEATTATVGDPNDAATQLALTYDHDQWGHVVHATAVDSFGDQRVACTSYEPTGVFPYATVNSVGHVVFTGFDLGFGVAAATVDPNGLSTSYQHDGFGRQTLAVFPDGTSSSTALTRSQSGGPQKTWWTIKLQQQQTQGAVTTTEIDGAYRPIHRTSTVAEIESCGQSKCAPTLTLEEDFRYDLFGRLYQSTLPWMSGDSLQGKLANTYIYDDVGRLVFRLEPWGRATAYTYQDNFVQTTDWLGTASAYADEMGRTVRTVDKLGGEVETAYGPFSQPKSITRFGTETRSWVRDAYGRVRQETDPDRGITTSTYDGYGETRTVHDASGRDIEFYYDGIGRRIARVDGGSATPGVTTWEYDTAPFGRGLLAKVTNPTNDVDRYAYDDKSRPAGHTLTFANGESFQWSQTYDAYGRPWQLTYPTEQGSAPFVVRREYDAFSNLVALHDDQAQTTFWHVQELDGAGRLRGEALGNGVTSERTYDPAKQRVTHIHAVRFKSKVQQTTLQDLDYAYDFGLRMSSRTDELQPALFGSATEVFRHDALDRLRCWSVTNGLPFPGECEHAIDYEPNGNILAKDGVGYGYDPGHPHAVTKAGAEEFAYDAVGNQTKRPGVAAIAYTPFDLPERYHLDDGSDIEFDYDGNQHRIRKQVGVTETVYLDAIYDRVRTVQQDVHKFYVAAGTSTVVVTRRSGVADQVNYVLTDALGSTDVITDGAGQEVERRSYDAFGARRNHKWLGPTQTNFLDHVTPTGFTGLESDDEEHLGLVNMRGRIYDPKLGRFLQTDPLVANQHFTQSWNAYSFVHNSPLNSMDPSGFLDTSADPDYPAFGTPPPQDAQWVNETLVVEPVPLGGYQMTIQGSVDEAMANDAARDDVVDGQPAVDGGGGGGNPYSGPNPPDTPVDPGDTGTGGGAAFYTGPGTGATLAGGGGTDGSPANGGRWQTSEARSAGTVLTLSLAAIPLTVAASPVELAAGASGAARLVPAGALGSRLAPTAGAVAAAVITAGQNYAQEIEAEVDGAGPQVVSTATALGNQLQVAAAPVIDAVQVTGVQANRIIGNAAADEFAQHLVRNMPGIEVEREVFFPTPMGARFVDIVLREGNRIVGLIEVKTGGSPYYASQQAKDYWIWLVYGVRTAIVRD